MYKSTCRLRHRPLIGTSWLQSDLPGSYCFGLASFTNIEHSRTPHQHWDGQSEYFATTYDGILLDLAIFHS